MFAPPRTLPSLWINLWLGGLVRLWATARFLKSLPHFRSGGVTLRWRKLGNADCIGSERNRAGEQILKPPAPGITQRIVGVEDDIETGQANSVLSAVANGTDAEGSSARVRLVSLQNGRRQNHPLVIGSKGTSNRQKANGELLLVTG